METFESARSSEVPARPEENSNAPVAPCPSLAVRNPGVQHLEDPSVKSLEVEPEVENLEAGPEMEKSLLLAP